MTKLSICVGLLLLLIVLWDTFETIVLPRTVTRRLRLTNLFYRKLWSLFSALAGRRVGRSWRETLLNAFGPLSLLLLIGFWAGCLIVAFTLIQWGLGSQLSIPNARVGLGIDLYMSGTTFFTLGLGDVTPNAPSARVMTVMEGGMGFGFLALVIGYLPVLYQSFSRREMGISLLDARAGSPPTGAELLRRHSEAQQMEALVDLLAEWERWASDILESHLSYPVLVFYRSQHDRESWLAALTAILDTCALIRVGFERSAAWQSRLAWQAQLTFAMARHTVIDLALIMRTEPSIPDTDRLPQETFQQLCELLHRVDLPLCRDTAAVAQLNEIRQQYEPYVDTLAKRLLLDLPPWLSSESKPDNWQTSAWGQEHFLA